MRQKVFFDSSALFVWTDNSSPQGKKIADWIRAHEPQLITTDLVIAETVSLITKRIGKHDGIRFLGNIMQSEIIRIIYTDEKIFHKASQQYRHYKDKDFDLIDSMSFVICEQMKIREVLSLDRHFTQMNFQLVSLE